MKISCVLVTVLVALASGLLDPVDSSPILYPRTDATFYTDISIHKVKAGSIAGQKLADLIYDHTLTHYACQWNAVEQKETCERNSKTRSLGKIPGGDLMIHFIGGNFPKEYPGIRELLTEQVSSIFRDLSDLNACTDNCTIPGYVGVLEDSTGAFLRIFVRTPSTGKPFPCDDIKRLSIGNFDKNIRSRLSTLIRKNDIGSFVTCKTP
ncbi:hypothetical protein BS50DRAFT_653384 [Corynespora cassiicola Philippines]|uniref:Killer toxin Kp4 domain-containing protein n=1 Tax=Corynespora cassiicola Philippines TaxID=1448308 RepID=A0A2T2P6C8_CORCC|nr:hypothetical protein BS50DRAFT_653384 [Corynespora cassiicola Philippines]